jgi:hypothetical protein
MKKIVHELLEMADLFEGVQLPLNDMEKGYLVTLYKAGKNGLPHKPKMDQLAAYQYVETIDGVDRLTVKGIRHAENIMKEYGKSNHKKYQF